MPMPDKIEASEDFIETISILAAIKAKVSPQTQVHYAKGCDVIGESTEGFDEAIAAAKQAQIAVLVVGDKAGLTDSCTSGEARDRAILDLPGVQGDLVRAIHKTGTPIVLVLINGRPVTLNSIAEDVPSIIEAWFPSEEGANAVADVLFGDVNPGGKLPITFPRTVGQVPSFYGHRPSGGRSHWKEDYVETSVKPLYPFGFGLSYTHFQFSNMRIEKDKAQAGESVTVRVDVSNVGDRAGDEVVQLYIHQYVTQVTRPVKELKAFKRVTLQAGETQTVTLELAVNQLAFYDHALQYVVEPGTVEVMVGNSSQDIHCTDTFEITGKTTLIGSGKVSSTF
jgi:beta-glucosidase